MLRNKYSLYHVLYAARRGSRGITLVEILITMSIMVILLGISVPAYGVFNTNQQHRQSVEDLLATLKDVQNRGTNNDLANKCPVVPGSSPPVKYDFDGWYVKVVRNTSSYTLGATCSSTAAVSPTPRYIEIDVNGSTAGTVTELSYMDTNIISALVTPYDTTFIRFKPVTQNVLFCTGTAPDFLASGACPAAANAQITIRRATRPDIIVNVTSVGAIYANY